MTEKKKYGIGGKLNIIEGLEELRERLKKLGGKEVLSDEEWKAGGIKERKTYRAKPGAKAPRESLKEA